jgi:hypothetical protein
MGFMLRLALHHVGLPPPRDAILRSYLMDNNKIALWFAVCAVSSFVLHLHALGIQRAPCSRSQKRSLPEYHGAYRSFPDPAGVSRSLMESHGARCTLHAAAMNDAIDELFREAKQALLS